MYFPYLRGKQFEINALLNVSNAIYSNTLPILEPVTLGKGQPFRRLSDQGIPLVLVMNPYYPLSARLSTAAVQQIVDTQMVNHQTLSLGFLVDARFSLVELNAFLASNPTRPKVLIIDFNPLQADLNAIQAACNAHAHAISYLVFNARNTSVATQNFLTTTGGKVLITDGFQRHDRNADYPASSSFQSDYATWRANGWQGIGDYLTIGNHFQEGGGQVFVITLHLTRQAGQALVVDHFSSTVNANVRGLPAPKFAQALNNLVTSPFVIPQTSSGLTMYRSWHHTHHNPHLGAAKQASCMHHMELLSSIV